MAPKDGSCKGRIHFLRANVAKLAVEDEIVAFGAQVDGGFLAEEDEGKDIAILLRTETVRNGQLQEACGIKRTFARQLKKNLYGSIP